MTAPLPPEAVERIDEICDRFEAEWKAGGLPLIANYLDGETGPQREALLNELERVDAFYRQRADELVTVVGSTVAVQSNPTFIAGYELLDELGRGGMGVVYLARQLRPNRLVALKVISAGAHAGSRELDRFRSEADAVARLHHPDIVQIYEVGEHAGCPYFTLEYVAGGSLDRFLGGVPQPPIAAAQLVERLSHAIHHAHELGIIHRDLKPANVLLQKKNPERRVSGEVVDQTAMQVNESTTPVPSVSRLAEFAPKLTDFGLAKLLGSGVGGPTQSGELLGSPSYMAPEQVGGGTAEISAATDVYGLGAILYELLTGRPPFRGETIVDTVLQVQSVEPVSPSRLQPKCPRDLATICLKCLTKLPRQRYASARELADDLRRFLDRKPIRARPVGPLRQTLKWTLRQPAVASLVGLLLVAVGVGVSAGSWFWWQAERGREAAEAALGKEQLAQSERVATLDRFQVALAHREWLANNGGRAFALLDACTEQQRQSWEWRYLDRMLHSALHTFTGHGNTVQALAVHPSGRRVASASHDSNVRVWDLDTGSGRVIGKHQFLALAVAYSPDGRWLASSGSQDGIIKLWDGQTGDALSDIEFDDSGGAAIWSIAFDPSSRYLAAGSSRRVKVWDMLDRQWVFDQVAHNGSISKVAFSPDPEGRFLATTVTNVRVWDWATRSSKPLHILPGCSAGTYDLAFSPDGKLLATGGRDALIRFYSLDSGKEEFTLNAHQLAVTSVGFSRDGTRLASAGLEGDMHVWNVIKRQRLFTLHGHSGSVWDLEFVPGDKQLVSAGHDFLVRVWNAAEGQEAFSLPFKAPSEVSALAYSPNGRLLAWGDIRGQCGVWDSILGKEILRRVETRPPSVNPIQSFAFSPDGRRLAWRRREGPATLWDLAAAAEVPMLGQAKATPRGLTFSTDGNRLLAALSEGESLKIVDLLTGNELLKLPRNGNRIYQVVWSPDGECLATSEGRTIARLWSADSGEPLGAVEYPSSLTGIAFSQDSRYFCVGGVGGGIKVFDRRLNRLTMAVSGHSSRVFGLALSPDGRRLASAGSDCTIKLWDTQTGNEVLTLRSQLHEHSPLVFSPDGTGLVSVTIDNQLQIWSTRNNHEKPADEQPHVASQ